MSRIARIHLAVLAAAWIPLGAWGQGDPVVVVVDNATAAINGNSANIKSLIQDPGPDGISFPEAFRAANGTTGSKVITFAPDLLGATIEVTTNAEDRQLFVFVSPDITINGDIFGNGTRGITFVGARNSTFVFAIRSSRATIRGVRIFTAFEGPAITFACLDIDCTDHAIHGATIVNNEIANALGSAIDISPGLPRPYMVPQLSDLFYEDVVIEGNDITAARNGIALSLGVMGFSNEHARNVVIRSNRVKATDGVRISAAEGSSPPDFSDDNLIENLTIDQNTFETADVAVSVFAASSGDSNNRISGLQITGNHIRSARGIEVVATRDGSVRRSGRSNIIDEVTIAGNQMTTTASGIAVSAADLPASESSSAGFESNTVHDVTIDGNTISGYSEAGIRLWGGVANVGLVNGNIVHEVTMTNNVMSAASPDGAGIVVTGGEARMGIARQNSVRALSIAGNRASGNATGVLLIGGDGAKATSNNVELIQFAGNDLQGNGLSVSAVDNSNGANGNAVVVPFPRRRSAR